MDKEIRSFLTCCFSDAEAAYRALRRLQFALKYGKIIPGKYGTSKGRHALKRNLQVLRRLTAVFAAPHGNYTGI
ncbi:MAG: hypothetical protein SOY13_09545, partial [Pseudoflavonifractor sp.]|nr:hypothetical protein [Pseudoflavonifractor sp.]